MAWKFSNDSLVPIINKNLQAVLVIVEIIFGGCRKECLSNRRKSFYNRSCMHRLM